MTLATENLRSNLNQFVHALPFLILFRPENGISASREGRIGVEIPSWDAPRFFVPAWTSQKQQIFGGKFFFEGPLYNTQAGKALLPTCPRPPPPLLPWA